MCSLMRDCMDTELYMLMHARPSPPLFTRFHSPHPQSHPRSLCHSVPSLSHSLTISLSLPTLFSFALSSLPSSVSVFSCCVALVSSYHRRLFNPPRPLDISVACSSDLSGGFPRPKQTIDTLLSVPSYLTSRLFRQEHSVSGMVAGLIP